MDGRGGRKEDVGSVFDGKMAGKGEDEQMESSAQGKKMRASYGHAIQCLVRPQPA